MIECPLSGKWHAPPSAMDRAVNMTEENMTNVTIPLQKPGKIVPARQCQMVHGRQVEHERRMMHREKNILSPQRRERAIDPSQPMSAEAAFMRASLVRVEQHERPCGRLEHCLHEPVLVHRHLGEHGLKDRTVVMVPDEQMPRHGQRVERLAQSTVGGSFAAMREIARDQHELGVAMVCIDVGDCSPQPLVGIKAIQLATRRYQMRVGQMDELHWRHQFSTRSARTSLLIAASACSAVAWRITTVCM